MTHTKDGRNRSLRQAAGFLLKGIGLIAAAAALGTLLLTAVFLCPVNEESFQKSYALWEEEGWYPDSLNMGEEYDVNANFHSFLPGILDNHTDMIMLSTATRVVTGSPLQAAMEAYSGYLNDTYVRYWHGYVVILRPLLLFLDYGQLRVVNGVVQLLLALCLAVLLWRRAGRVGGNRWLLLAALLTSLFLLAPSALWRGLQYSWVYGTALLTAIVLVWRADRLKEGGKYLYVFLAAGIGTSFLDLLTYPLFTWSFPLVWFLLLSGEEISWKKSVCRVAASGLSWLLGYGGMWAAKWGMASLILKQNVAAAAMENVAVRSGTADGMGLAERFEAIYRNWKHYTWLPYAIILCVWLAAFGYVALRGRLAGNQKLPALFLVMSAGFVWCFVLADHTMTHHFFTYRSFNGCILAFCAIVVSACSQTAEERTPGRLRLTVLCTFFVVVAAAALTLTAREDLVAINGQCEFTELALADGGHLRMRFTPTFSKINSVGFGVRNNGADGVFTICVSDGEKPLYEEELSLSVFGEMVYVSVPVEWRLRHGHSYVLELSAQYEGEEIGVLVTQNGELPLLEYGDMELDGAAVAGQPLSGLQYRYRPTDKKLLLFLMTGWLGYLGAGAAAAAVLFRKKSDCRAVREKGSRTA